MKCGLRLNSGLQDNERLLISWLNPPIPSRIVFDTLYTFIVFVEQICFIFHLLSEILGALHAYRSTAPPKLGVKFVFPLSVRANILLLVSWSYILEPGISGERKMGAFGLQG